jgi:hypothetical protein
LTTDTDISLIFKLSAHDYAAPKQGEPYRVSIAPEYVIPLKG